MYLETWFIIKRPTAYFRGLYTNNQTEFPAAPGNETSRPQAWTSMDFALDVMMMDVYSIHITYTLSQCHIVCSDRYYCCINIRTESGHRGFTIPLYVYTVRVYVLYTICINIYIYMIIRVYKCLHTWSYTYTKTYNNSMSHIIYTIL